jgi:hypothetical protein
MPCHEAGDAAPIRLKTPSMFGSPSSPSSIYTSSSTPTIDLAIIPIPANVSLTVICMTLRSGLEDFYYMDVERLMGCIKDDFCNSTTQMIERIVQNEGSSVRLSKISLGLINTSCLSFGERFWRPIHLIVVGFIGYFDIALHHR